MSKICNKILRSSVVLSFLCCIILKSFPYYLASSKVFDDNIKITGSHYVAKGKTIRLKTNKKVIWSSNDEKTASISKKGKVTGKKAGKVIITATLKEDKSIKETYTIIVIKHAVKMIITSNIYEFDLKDNSEITLHAFAIPITALQLFEWNSSNPDILNINQDGVIKGVSAGTAVITITAKDGSQCKTKLKIKVMDSSPIDILTKCTNLRIDYSNRTIEQINENNVENSYIAINKNDSLSDNLYNDQIQVNDIEDNLVKNEITLRGTDFIRIGKSVPFKVEFDSQIDQNHKIEWKSENPDIATVDSNGIVTGISEGVTSIIATDINNMELSEKTEVHIGRFSKNDTKWIAHRGLSADVMENTAMAYRLANEAGFWGCECDIWETKHVLINDSDNSYFDCFDLVINHDASFNNIVDIEKNINELTVEDIKGNPTLKNVCFFETFLDICNDRDIAMAPIVEIKDFGISDAGIEKMLRLIEERNLLEITRFISFSDVVLERIQYYAIQNLGYKPECCLLIYIGMDVDQKLDIASEKGFSGVGIEKTLLTDQYYDKCKSLGLNIEIYTYSDTTSDDDLLYLHFLSGKYNINSATVNGKPFD